jgi:hypothetical protein
MPPAPRQSAHSMHRLARVRQHAQRRRRRRRHDRPMSINHTTHERRGVNTGTYMRAELRQRECGRRMAAHQLVAARFCAARESCHTGLPHTVLPDTVLPVTVLPDTVLPGGAAPKHQGRPSVRLHGLRYLQLPAQTSFKPVHVPALCIGTPQTLMASPTQLSLKRLVYNAPKLKTFSGSGCKPAKPMQRRAPKLAAWATHQ